MIIASAPGEEPLVVGTRYGDKFVSDGNCQYHVFPFLVLRAATLDEYLAYTVEVGVRDHVNLAEVSRAGNRFYEISTD